MNSASGQVVHTIETLPGSGSQATGAYNGQYAVWKESHSAGNIDHFSIREWNRTTDAITTVGGSHTLPDGQVAASSYQDPVINHTYAAWDEGVDANGTSEIVVLNLRTGARAIVRQGHPGWIALTSRRLIWAESPRAGADTIIHALALATNKPSPPPAALARLRGAWAFVESGPIWAWIGGSPQGMYVAANRAKPVRIGSVPQGGASPPITSADGVMAVPVSAGGLVLLNLHTRAWTYIPNASYATAQGRAHFLLPRVAQKGAKSHGPVAIAKLGPTDLASIVCPSE